MRGFGGSVKSANKRWKQHTGDAGDAGSVLPMLAMKVLLEMLVMLVMLAVLAIQIQDSKTGDQSNLVHSFLATIRLHLEP